VSKRPAESYVELRTLAAMDASIAAEKPKRPSASVVACSTCLQSTARGFPSESRALLGAHEAIAPPANGSGWPLYTDVVNLPGAATLVCNHQSGCHWMLVLTLPGGSAELPSARLSLAYSREEAPCNQTQVAARRKVALLRGHKHGMLSRYRRRVPNPLHVNPPGST